MLFLAGSAGCCAIAHRLGPTDDSEIAARELARLGLDAMHRGQLPEAKARFVRALDKSPKNPQARHHLAQLLWQTGDREQAILEMDSAVLHSGGDPDWTVELGRMLLEQNDPDGALRCAQVALQTSSRHTQAWQLRGDVLSRNHDLEGAKQAYHQSLTGNPTDPETLMNLAEIYRLEGKALRALAILQRLEQNSRHSAPLPGDLYYRQALAMQALGRYDAACEMFAKARPDMPQNPELLLLLSECQFNAGRLDEARDTLAATRQLLPGDPRVQRLAESLHAVGPAIASSQ